MRLVTSTEYGPREILYRENTDYNKKCKLQFGTYCEAHYDTNPKKYESHNV